MNSAKVLLFSLVLIVIVSGIIYFFINREGDSPESREETITTETLCEKVESSITLDGQIFNLESSSPSNEDLIQCYLTTVDNSSISVLALKGEESLSSYNLNEESVVLENVEMIPGVNIGDKSYGFHFNQTTSVDALDGDKWVHVSVVGNVEDNERAEKAIEIVNLALGEL